MYKYRTLKLYYTSFLYFIPGVEFIFSDIPLFQNIARNIPDFPNSESATLDIFLVS